MLSPLRLADERGPLPSRHARAAAHLVKGAVIHQRRSTLSFQQTTAQHKVATIPAATPLAASTPFSSRRSSRGAAKSTADAADLPSLSRSPGPASPTSRLRAPGHGLAASHRQSLPSRFQRPPSAPQSPAAPVTDDDFGLTRRPRAASAAKAASSSDDRAGARSGALGLAGGPPPVSSHRPPPPVADEWADSPEDSPSSPALSSRAIRSGIRSEGRAGTAPGMSPTGLSVALVLGSHMLEDAPPDDDLHLDRPLTSSRLSGPHLSIRPTMADVRAEALGGSASIRRAQHGYGAKRGKADEADEADEVEDEPLDRGYDVARAGSARTRRTPATLTPSRAAAARRATSMGGGASVGAYPTLEQFRALEKRGGR